MNLNRKLVLKTDEVSRILANRIKKPYKRQVFTNMVKEFDSCEVNYLGNFTVVRLKKRGRNASITGVAKCNPIDDFNPAIGLVIATCRALREYGQEKS